MKTKQIWLIILLLLLIDQVVKIYVKLHFQIGESIPILGQEWAKILFVENPGMAWGLQFGGNVGKIALSVFRLAAVIWGAFYISNMYKKKFHLGFVWCIILIFAGAAGNLIDSMFYGILFDKGSVYDATLQAWVGYDGLAQFTSSTQPGYAHFFKGVVVDMFYFPIINEWTIPNWIPLIGGKTFSFFEYIFNIADTYISIGIIALFIWWKKIVPHS